MEKLLLSAEQAREVTSTKGYEWTKTKYLKELERRQKKD